MVIQASLRKSAAGLIVAACVQSAICVVIAHNGYPSMFVFLIFPLFLVLVGGGLYRLLFRDGPPSSVMLLCGTFAIFTVAASHAVAGERTGALNVAEPLIGLGGFAVGMAGGRASGPAAFALVAVHRTALVAAGSGSAGEHLMMTVIECGSVTASVVGSWRVRLLARRLDAEEGRVRRNAARDAAASTAHAEMRERRRLVHDAPVYRLWLVGEGVPGDPAAFRRACAEDAALLRGRADDWRTGLDLSAALQDLAGYFDGQGLHVTLDLGVDESHPRDPRVVAALVLVVQQALVNTVRHSGQDEAGVVVRAVDGRTEVEISDRGSGFRPGGSPGRLGFSRSITQRMADAGGRASVESEPGQGTTVTLRWPR